MPPPVPAEAPPFVQRVTGEIIAAWGDDHFLRHPEADDQETIHAAPLFAYLSPGRFAAIDRSNAFPFPESMKK